MPLLALAVVALVVLLSVHVCKTGRSKMWLPVIWVLPVLGSIIYVLVEMLPALVARQDAADDAAAKAARKSEPLADQVDRKIERMVARRAREVDVDAVLRDGTVHTRLKLAEDCLAQGRFDEADALFGKARDGFFIGSPDIIFGQARARFGRDDKGRGDMASVLALLDELAKTHPSFQPHAVAILKARATARMGDVTAAIPQLQAVLAEPENLEGRRLEAQYRYAEILWQAGEIDKAKAALTDLQRYEKLFRVGEEERQWIRLAAQAQQAIS
jgi:hypothetical protein